MDLRVGDSVSLGIAWFISCPEPAPDPQKNERTVDSGRLSPSEGPPNRLCAGHKEAALGRGLRGLQGTVAVLYSQAIRWWDPGGL